MVAFFYIKVIRRMIFLKTFNNSAALVQDNQGQEQVVLGKGVGFGLKRVIRLMKAKLKDVSLLTLIKMRLTKLKKQTLRSSI